jgi:geranylgeranyl diphosphate synthase, type II
LIAVILEGTILATALPQSVRADGNTPVAAKPDSNRRNGPPSGEGYGHLMQVAVAMFQPQELERLAPRLHGTHSALASDHVERFNGQSLQGLDPLAATEAIAYDFLAKGGKHSRPFITLAAYQAIRAGKAASSPAACNGVQQSCEANALQLPDAVKRCALSIETFHKASLVHDDIEDDDEFRYGTATLHRKYGTPTAINVGDYLIGLGYRLVSREGKTLGPDVVSDILDHIADAHMKLSEGQGAELIWRDSHNKQLTPQDTLRIYALKTAPAFQAALHTGLRLAGSAEHYLGPIAQFSRALGVAFQIINDLNDWQGDNHNKLLAAGDIIGGRPTLLWALALEGLATDKRSRLETLMSEAPLSDEKLREIRRLYEEAGAFHKAGRLVEKHQQHAETLTAEIEPESLRRLFFHLIDMVLQRRQS